MGECFGVFVVVFYPEQVVGFERAGYADGSLGLEVVVDVEEYVHRVADSLAHD